MQKIIEECQKIEEYNIRSLRIQIIILLIQRLLWIIWI